jgi:hypothetical protein
MRLSGRGRVQQRVAVFARWHDCNDIPQPSGESRHCFLKLQRSQRGGAFPMRKGQQNAVMSHRVTTGG